ncbi:hypothetical protein [Marinobacter salarius]|jgi:hypothetical protein|uniref:hypothetical protein n=1 Tax=Marinobacter salarius TaxID=1420917 RepID=UPI0010AAC061|nr:MULTISPECIES: hypothetical protein [Marinobacter]MBJ7302559.1 hypothetical protein [Marinobacter salarius]HIO30724.1 hypothetical protein [Marinobacter salarius]HIP01777.1 hypothetical protein [Marinobacter salarius]
MDTIREKVVQAISARADTIISGTPVIRSEQYEDEPVFVCVWDLDQESEKTNYGTQKNTLQVVIEYLTGSAEKPYSSSANSMYGEVISAIINDTISGNPEPTLGGLATSIRETSSLSLTPEAGLKITGCSVTFEVIYETQNGDPYTQ